MTIPIPSSIERILIVGAGGFGRETLQWAQDAWPDHAGRFAGFLSADRDILRNQACDLPILADPAGFRPEAGDGLLLGIGIPAVRRRVAETLLGRGATFLSLVHPTAVVARGAAIGAGAVICPFAVVSDGARVGACALINYHASLAHDAHAGDYAVLSPYATLGGRACIGEDAFLGLHASVGPGCRVGDRSKVAANSCALSDVPADSLAYGVPGRVARLIG
jgi:sugar O-acyltransferase (sialic acid O-acetyltransferase NeuD family)